MPREDACWGVGVSVHVLGQIFNSRLERDKEEEEELQRFMGDRLGIRGMGLGA